MSDEDFVTEFIDKLKKQGLFDRFRKECLADVDTKPAYQNLQLRVKEAVGKYLHNLKWKADLSKNQLRENLRRHLNDLAMLTNGIDRVVDQVVKPKIMKSWKPQIDRSICEHMNIDYEQWLSDQNDVQDKKQTKQEEMPLNIPPPILKTPSLVTPSFPTVVNVSVPPPTLNLQPLSIHPLTTNDLQAPPPPPPTSAEESNDPEHFASSPDPPLPPCPPPLPSEASDDDSAPAPPPDNLQSFSPPPPLPPDDAPVVRDDDDDMSIDEEDVFDGEKAKTSYIETHFSEIQVAREECYVSNDGAKNLPLKEKSTSRMSDFNTSSNFSNDNSFPFPGGNIEQFNTNTNNKDYRFAWNNFHESDLSNISVSSVHTSDLSNFEENEDDDPDSSLNDPGQNSKNPSSEGNSSKGSDHRLNMTARQSMNGSMQDSLDASNTSLLSSGRKRLKKEELKERKMEEKKELKRKRVLNRRYCSEEFMSIYNDKQDLLRDKSADDKADAKVTHSGPGLVESSTGGDEEASNKEGNASDVENAYSPYSNISEASSDSVVVVGVEPARPKKEKKSRSQRRSRSPDGSRKKRKKRRHRSSRRSSRHCSGGDDDDVEGCQMKQDVGRNKLTLCEFESSSRSYPEEEGYLMGEYDDDISLVEMKKRMKRNVDRINFGEAERQAAALRTGSIKPTQYPVASPNWQKQMFNTLTKPSRPHAYGQQNFHSIQSPSKHIRHTPSYHQLPLGHSIHEPRVYDRTKYDNEPDVYRLPRGSTKRTFGEGFEDNLNMDETKINKRSRQDDMLNSKGYPKNPVFHSEVEITPQKKQYEVTDKRNKR